jgi:zinc transport system ATP-binding protein
LSGGELQRVYLARSLVREPRLLVLDEPVAGIDAVGEQDMQRVLEVYRHRTRATVLMVTHDWETAYHHATHVLVLSRRQIAFGPPAAALTDEVLRRAFGHIDHPHGMHLSAEGHGDV